MESNYLIFIHKYEAYIAAIYLMKNHINDYIRILSETDKRKILWQKENILEPIVLFY